MICSMPRKVKTLHTFNLICKCWHSRKAPFMASPHLVTLHANFYRFSKSQMFFANHGTSRHVEKGAPVGPEPILLGQIDTGTIPLCGGPSAKPDCKHKHYELIYVKHYELSIVSHPFLCVFQNQVSIMFRFSFAPTGPSFCRPYQPRERPNVQDMR